MKKIVIGIVVAAVVLSILIVPQCVDKVQDTTATDNKPYVETPILTPEQRIKILEDTISDLRYKLELQQRQLTQQQEDMVALQREINELEAMK